MLSLLVLQGPDKGRRFELADEAVLIGRGSRAVPLTDNTISRRHCEITPRDEAVVLTDLGSANGTFINGMRVKSAQAIHVGDQLRIGRTVMVFGSLPGVRGGRGGSGGGESGGVGGVELAGEEAGVDSAIMHVVGANDDSLVLAVPDPSAAAVSNLQILYQLGAALGSSFDVEHAMAITLDLIFEHVKAERGMVMIVSEKTGELEPVVVRTRETPPTPPNPPAAGGGGGGGGGGIRASRTIVEHVRTSGEGVLSSNAMADRRFSKGKSVHDMGIRSAICVPIKAGRLSERGPEGDDKKRDGVGREGVLGVIYIDSSVRNYTYSPDQLRLLSAIGVQAGMAVQNVKLYRAGIRAERLAAIGETTAALSHSVKNILQALRGGADVVEMGLAAGNLGQAGKGWGIVQRNLDKIYSLTMNLLAYSRSRGAGAELVQPGRVIREVVELVAVPASERGVAVLEDVEEEHPPVPMDADGIYQALMNLVGNAVDAAESVRDRPEGESGLVRIVSRYDEGADEAVIEVVDNGPGIPPTMRDHLFELFHSTKGNRGTGLGLAVSRKIVEEHEGTITAESPPHGPVSGTAGGNGGGTLVRIRLPMKRLIEPADSSETSGHR